MTMVCPFADNWSVFYRTWPEDMLLVPLAPSMNFLRNRQKSSSTGAKSMLKLLDFILISWLSEPTWVVLHRHLFRRFLVKPPSLRPTESARSRRDRCDWCDWDVWGISKEFVVTSCLNKSIPSSNQTWQWTNWIFHILCHDVMVYS